MKKLHSPLTYFVVLFIFWAKLYLVPHFDKRYVLNQCTIIKIYDGDTVKLYCPERSKEEREVVLRLMLMDAFEKDQLSYDGKRIGEESTLYLKKLLRNKKKVFVQLEKKDKYGRSLGHLLLSDSESPFERVSYQMVKAGYALIYPQTVFASKEEKKIYDQALSYASFTFNGVWDTQGAQAPWSFRKTNKVSKKR